MQTPEAEYQDVLQQTREILGDLPRTNLPICIEGITDILSTLRQLLPVTDPSAVFDETVDTFISLNAPVADSVPVIAAVIDLCKASTAKTALMNKSWKAFRRLLEAYRGDAGLSAAVAPLQPDLFGFLLSELAGLSACLPAKEVVFKFYLHILNYVHQAVAVAQDPKTYLPPYAPILRALPPYTPLVLSADLTAGVLNALAAFVESCDRDALLAVIPELPFPLPATLVPLINQPPLRSLQLALTVLSVTSPHSIPSYSALYAHVVAIMPSLVLELSRFLDLLKAFQHTTTLTQVFVARILHLVVSLLPPTARLPLLSTVSSPSPFLFPLLLSDPENDGPLSSFYLDHLSLLPGSSHLLRFLRASRSLQVLHTLLPSLSPALLAKFLTPVLLDHLPRDAFLRTADFFRSDPSFLAALNLSAVFSALPPQTQRQVKAAIKPVPENVPLLPLLSVPTISALLAAFPQTSPLPDRLHLFLAFFQFAQIGNEHDIRRAGKPFECPFVAFLQTPDPSLFPTLKRPPPLPPDPKAVLADLGQIIENVRQELRRSGTFADEWNRFVSRLVNARI